MTRRRWCHLALACLALTWVACSSTSSSNSEDCPNIGGTWLITKHCQPGFVGNETRSTQTDCQLVTNDQYKFGALVKADGTFSISAIVDGAQMTCEGELSGATVFETCATTDGGNRCAIQLDRP